MLIRNEITCIRKGDCTGPHDRIVGIGGRNEDWASWKLTQQEAIEGIERGVWTFCVRSGSSLVNVVVSVSRHGNKCLTAEADGEEPDELLSLPECR